MIISKLRCLDEAQKGFTLTETIISISVASVMIIVMFSVTFNYYAYAVQSQEAASLALESQTLLSQMVEDLRLSEGVGASNQLADPYAPSGGWQTSDDNNVLVVRSPAITSSQDIIYRPDTGFPYLNEYVYFLEGSTMYKRVIKNADAVNNTAVSTCPEANATSACPADRVFSENASSVSFTMYDLTDAETSDPLLARSVRLTVGLGKTVFGRNISLSNTMHVTQRNQ